MIALSMFSIGIITLGTYALWSQILATNENTISTGQVKMSYTEVNELALSNALPMRDEDGKKLTNYFDFSVSSYIKTNANDNTEQKLNYNVILEPLTVTNPLNDNEIKVYLTKIENGTETEVTGPTTIDKLNQYVIKSQEEVFNNNKGEVTTSYRIRAWIDYDVNPDKFNDKSYSYSYKFRVNVNNEAAPKVDYALNFAKSKVGTDGLELVTHEIDDTLQVDKRFATEYRYRGGDSVVKNYVTFNNETWRIIGIMPTEDASGNIENRIKIIREESIGKVEWNDCRYSITSGANQYICNDTGKYGNDWTNATLNTYLNNDYYNTLSTDAKNMIGTTKYYLGGFEYETSTLDTMWQTERKNDANRTWIYYKTNPVMQNDVSKKIALMYGSDYGYAASKECATTVMRYDSDSLCIETNNWLDKRNSTWTLTPDSGTGAYANYVNSKGAIYGNGSFDYGGMVDSNNEVFPVLSLASNVKISGGEGTSSNPYTLSIA